jgi:hypothetical protein
MDPTAPRPAAAWEGANTAAADQTVQPLDEVDD